MGKDIKESASLISTILKGMLEEYGLFIGFDVENKSLIFCDREKYLAEGKLDGCKVELEKINMI